MEIARSKVNPSFAYCPKVLHLEPSVHLLVFTFVRNRVPGSDLRSAAYRRSRRFAFRRCDDAGVDRRAPAFVSGGLLCVIDAFFRDLGFLYRHEVCRGHREVLRRRIPAAAVD